MARTTDRQIISEATRVSQNWTVDDSLLNCHLLRHVTANHWLDLEYSAAGRITRVGYYEGGGRVEITANKRKEVLDILKG